jgi:hypothetical protein
MSYHGGPVMSQVNAYLVFWLPPSYHYEAPGHGSDSNFERLVERYLGDLGGSSF